MPKFKTVILLTVVVLTAGLLYLFLQPRIKEFPVIPPGSYSGAVVFESADNNQNKLEIFAYIPDGGLQPALVTANPDFSIVNTGNSYKLISDNQEFYFFGEKHQAGAFEGVLETPAGAKAAMWHLTRIPEAGNLNTLDQVQTLSQLLNLNNELLDLEARIESRQIAVEQQKSEIEHLSEYINEGKSLKENADKKYREKKLELEKLLSEKEAKLKEAEGLREKFDISQRLFGMGKLVHLSRNTLDYEKQWFVSMYSSAAAELDPDFENLVARAERIKTLKNEIQYELSRPR